MRLLTSVAGEVNGDEGDELEIREDLVPSWLEAGRIELLEVPVVRKPGRAPRGGERAVRQDLGAEGEKR